jgi:catechol 2,3-dioxygenase-like lactoylglutathione lyase family enzyme
MITHVSIGVGDVGRSKRFYDAALAPLGYKCLRPALSMLGHGYGRDTIAFWVVAAERPRKSGLHFCFATPNANAVDAFLRCSQAGMTTARLACGQSMVPITTPPS